MDFEKLSDSDKIKMIELALKIHGCYDAVNRNNTMRSIEEVTDYIKEKTKIIAARL